MLEGNYRYFTKALPYCPLAFVAFVFRLKRQSIGRASHPVVSIGTAMRHSSVRTDSLTRGSYTFTYKRLRNILKNERIAYHRGINLRARLHQDAISFHKEIRVEIDTEYFDSEEVEGGTRFFSDADIRLRTTEFCRQLYGHDSPVSIAAKDIDAVFSKIFRFKFQPMKNSRTIIKQACNLLERMPAWPPELSDIPTTIPAEYRASSLAGNARGDARLWEQLQTTTYVSSTVLRVALSVAMSLETSAGHSLLDVTNITSTLLEMVSQLAPTSTDGRTSWRSFIIRAFLWTTWQRCQMLYFHLKATDAVIGGSSDGKIGKEALRGTIPSPGTTVHEMSERYAGLGKPAYMCGWNFELLRTDSVCIGADFRKFHQRYSAAFGDSSARCLAGQSYACKGESPRSCQRFHGMVIKDQSQHDQNCSRDCKQLIWDESSYRALSGGRAVHLVQREGSANEAIQYCNASNRTLAISHVWSQ